MTLEEILEFPANKLEAITDKEWLEFIGPYLKVTRPELADKPLTNKLRMPSTQEFAKKQKHQKAQGILASLGIDLDDL